MRHALITVIASFVGVIAALFAFYSYRDAEESRARAASDADQQARIEQGRNLVEQTIADERAAAAIRNDIAAISSARAAITESYMNTGRMPASNAEAGLPEPEKYKGQSLQSMTISDGGRILLSFDAASGVDGGMIEWLPDPGGIESMGLQWHCQTHDYPMITRIVPSCEYVPAGKAEIRAKR
ncbi:MAG TPA: pilin [Dokdonella sp.]|uniref:pilin n=1 Tax=Dokdonella sp. TaxID=2291710 RepID=UPI002D80A394|nr:pilin [Dokdonella sp.]HET9031460.1 pilin [Dokdonella sp.]